MKRKSIYVFVLSFVFFFTALSTRVSANEGATSCSRSFGILGISWSQSVTCGDGYSAYCGVFKAVCKENQ